LLWQRDELAMFIHFGVNTFSDREWGDGREDPRSFDPTAMDTRQWARIARETGFRAMVLTAKHHDGFCLWPTATTRHSVASSGWKAGQGDVVREFVEACRAEGLRVGLYLSPWDRNAESYGDSDRYSQFYCDQLTELLTRYGPVHEVWFDGANGEGPNGKRQVYDWPRYWGLVRRLQPEAVIFSDAGPDIRWIGNEHGVAGDTNWSMVDPSVVAFPGATGAAVERSLREGDAMGTVWRPGETDTSIRPGWFYHPAEDGRVRSVDALAELYFTSVGRNSKLLLNVPPTRAGLIHTVDHDRLRGMHSSLAQQFSSEATTNHATTWSATGSRSATAQVVVPSRETIAIVELREDISNGQQIASYVVEGLRNGAWHQLTQGTTVGYKKLDRIPPTSVELLRVRVTTLDQPRRFAVTAWHG
jgi:alpha-L-fucosidase